MLNLRSVVKNLPLLQKALAGGRSQLLVIIHDVRSYLLFHVFIFTRIARAKMITDGRLSKIESLIDANLNEDVAPAKVLLLLIF